MSLCPNWIQKLGFWERKLLSTASRYFLLKLFTESVGNYFQATLKTLCKATQEKN